MGLFSLNKKPTIDFLDQIITDSLTQEVAMKELALHIATSTIADLISKCRVRVYEHGKEVKNEFTYAMNINPNPNMPAARMWQKIISSSYDKDDGAILLPYQKRGTLQYVVADDYSIEKNATTDYLFSNITVNDFTFAKTYKEGDLFRFKFENASLRQYVDSMYSEYGNLLSFAIANYKNKNGMKYIWETDGQQTGDASFEEHYKEMIKNNLKEFIENPNSVLPQHKGQKLTDFSKGTTQSSDDILKIKKDTFDTIAQVFKIPQSVFYGNITNADQVFDEMITLVIAPHAELIGQELTRKSVSYEDYVKDSKVMLDPTTIKVQDILKLSANISGLIGSGAYSPNDVKDKLGDQRINEPWADKYYMTKNFALASDIADRKETTTNE